MAVLLVSAAALVVLWMWIDSLRFADVDKRATAHLEAVKVASAIAVGGGGLFALYLAARRQRTQELELELRREELHGRDLDAAERRVTELYTKAADQLGSDKAPVRLAGLYALDRLANDNPPHRQLVIDLLCAYLRMPYPAAETTSEQQAQEREVRLAVQRLLASRSRPLLDSLKREGVNHRYWPELYEFDLTGAALIDFDVNGCRMGRTSFARAAFLGQADFKRAEFTAEASFLGAVFDSTVEFTSAVFEDGARFEKARFEEDFDFQHARFSGFADFFRFECDSDATFAGTIFTGETEFGQAVFGGACDFVHASFTFPPDFIGARFGRKARFTNISSVHGLDLEGASFAVPPELADA